MPSQNSVNDFEHWKPILESEVYRYTRLFEQLESCGLVSGNGHHMRQNVARAAVIELAKHWTKREEIPVNYQGYL